MADHESKYGCPYVEGEIALAATIEDWDEVGRLIRTMLPNEQIKFQRAVEKIDSMIQHEVDIRTPFA